VFSAFGLSLAALGAWAAGIGAAQVVARYLLNLRGAAWSPSTRCLHVPGSWLPLALILGSFAVKYFAGYNVAVNPALAATAGFAGLCSLAYGSVSGLFMARALSLRSLATAPQAQAA
jgi:CBS-domain-containing membrane protein